MFLSAVLSALPVPWPWQAAKSPASAGSAGRRPRGRATESGAPAEHTLPVGQSLMLRLPRGTVVHVHAGVIDVEDTPSLWADHCWPQPRRFRAGQVWVVPRTTWWRLDSRVSRDPASRISCRG
ncbi:hypothetical protein ACNI65_23415 [Roseateles sp. So40a]|uniref:hypothetical protein n=1 Tax=Roseateles sp. So40a TaxID=3400226 RepID=UPI003A850D79